MSDNLNTDDANIDTSAKTGASQNTDTSASGDDEQVTLSVKDYKNLQSQRDSANEKLKKYESAKSDDDDDDSSNSPYDNKLVDILKEREIDNFLNDNKEKYPDISREDLMFLDDPDKLDKAANHLQTSINEKVQQKISNVQIADNRPQLSAKDINKQIDQLENSNDPQAFEKMVDLKSI